jgi:uncharacterized protein (DUF697 family)
LGTCIAYLQAALLFLFTIKNKYMHNLSNEFYQNEFEFESGQQGYELSPEFEFNNELYGETADELYPEMEYGFETGNQETDEFELAQELTEINNEYEFGNWLKKIARKGAGLARNFIEGPVGSKAIQTLGGIAKKTLPSLASRAGGFIGKKLGGTIGMGAAGQQLGQQLGQNAAGAVADRYPDFVKFATDTFRNIANEVNAGNPAPAVKPAVVKAASKHYPYILKVKGTLYGSPVSSNEFEYNEYNNEYSNEFEQYGEITSSEATFNEITEMELASELLSVQSEAELDRFLGKLFKKAAGAVSNLAKSATGKSLGGMLKGIAKKALPLAGGALGSFIPVPGIGTALGTAVGSAAGNLFELELEGLSPEDREFETAKAYVRLAGNAARRASRMQRMNPRNAAKQSIIHAAKRYAPGLLVSNHHYHNNSSGGTGSDGTWYRDGDRIVIEGV